MKPIEKAERDKRDLAEIYDVDVSAIVWIGNNKYIIIKDGCQILV